MVPGRTNQDLGTSDARHSQACELMQQGNLAAQKLYFGDC